MNRTFAVGILLGLSLACLGAQAATIQIDFIAQGDEFDPIGVGGFTQAGFITVTSPDDAARLVHTGVTGGAALLPGTLRIEFDTALVDVSSVSFVLEANNTSADVSATGSTDVFDDSFGDFAFPFEPIPVTIDGIGAISEVEVFSFETEVYDFVVEFTAVPLPPAALLFGSLLLPLGRRRRR